MLTFAQEREAHERQLEQSRLQQRVSLIQQIQAARGNTPLVVYYSTNVIDDNEVMNFYQLFSGVGQVDNLDLFLFSYGGLATDAYKLATLLRQHCKRLGILIPYKAKSAGTLVALAGDELVMGPPSELGPIDPQIPVRLRSGEEVWVSAQAIREGLEFFESRVKGDPEKALLYSTLVREVSPYIIGQYERETKASKQYAETLLEKYQFKGGAERAQWVADRLAAEFYTHGYVIDRVMARDELTLNVVFAEDVNVWDPMWDLHNLYQLYLREHPEVGGIAQCVNAQIDLPTSRGSLEAGQRQGEPRDERQ